MTAPLSNALNPSEEPAGANEKLISRCPSAASARVTSTGTTMNAVVTSAERPTIAFGLRRMVLKAPSKKSPSVSGRRATTPGLCTCVP